MFLDKVGERELRRSKLLAGIDGFSSADLKGVEHRL